MSEQYSKVKASGLPVFQEKEFLLGGLPVMWWREKTVNVAEIMKILPVRGADFVIQSNFSFLAAISTRDDF